MVAHYYLASPNSDACFIRKVSEKSELFDAASYLANLFGTVKSWIVRIGLQFGYLKMDDRKVPRLAPPGLYLAQVPLPVASLDCASPPNSELQAR